MKKLKFELDTWDQGRSFMEETAQLLNSEVVERGEILIIDHPEANISCNLDTREFSFLIVKLHNEMLLDSIDQIKSRHQ